MWAWSAEARAALARGHTAVTRVDVLHSGRPVYTLDVIGGAVDAESGRPVLRNLTATLLDPTGTLTRGDIDDLLDPYECEIAPHRGVRLSTTVLGSSLTPNAGFGLQPFGTSGFGGSEGTTTATRNFRYELAPLGVFGLTARRVEDTPDGLTISIAGQDRAMGYQGPMSSALAIPGGTPVEEAILRLLLTRNRGVGLSTMATGFTCGPLLYAPDIDVWREAQALAESVGASLYHDRTGQPVLTPAGPASNRAVARYAEGDGLLLSVSRAEDSDTIRNVVVAETPDGRIRVVVEDDEPSSPTYAGGRYGRRVHTLVNQHFSNLQQATVAASARLAYELGRSETVDFTAVPDPGRDLDEVVTIHRPRAGLDERSVVVASVNIPLSASEVMGVGCRQSRIAPDGRVVEAPRVA
jgi:hypothetical protein